MEKLTLAESIELSKLLEKAIDKEQLIVWDVKNKSLTNILSMSINGHSFQLNIEE